MLPAGEPAPSPLPGQTLSHSGGSFLKQPDSRPRLPQLSTWRRDRPPASSSRGEGSSSTGAGGSSGAGCTEGGTGTGGGGSELKAASFDLRDHYKDWDPATRRAAARSHRRAEFAVRQAMSTGTPVEDMLAACESALDWEALMFVVGRGDEVTPACHMPRASVPRKRLPNYWKTYKRTPRLGCWTKYQRSPRPAG